MSAALARAAADGNDRALGELVARYHDQVHRFGKRACHDAFDADDAVQEAFVKLAARPDVMRGESVLGWLRRVVENACRRLLRPFAREKRALGERADGEAIPAEGPSAEDALERWALVRAVHAAIAAIDAPYREVLVLRDLEGLTGAETAAALRLEEAAMKTRLHRARAQLRDRLRQTTREGA